MDDQTLNLMEKARTGEDNIQAVRTLLARGIAVELGVIPGFPGDTRERFLGTINVISDLMKEYPARVSMSLAPFTLTPGQPIFSDLEAFGLSTKSWDAEYLEIAPEYNDITKDIPCVVNGDNQGIERVGQMALLEFTARINRRSASSSRQEQNQSAAPVSVWQFDLLSSQFRLTPVQQGWYLGVRVASAGNLYGAILSDREIHEFQNLRYLATLNHPEVIANDELPLTMFEEFFENVKQKHLIAPSDIPRLSRFCGLSEAGVDWQLAISPHSVARLIPSGSENKLIVANIIAVNTAVLSTDVMPILELIDRSNITSEGVEDFIERELQLDVTRWRSIKKDLIRMGVLVSYPLT
jgi:hypothetical protein